ncbi:MAG TPA: L,D-transpeptidase [Verrucomicrobiae bacterium]|jgi:peptidoglycan hydrolase-like protein with peptidoglycan-binding domain
MVVPLLQKMPSKRRSRPGDFLAVVLLLAVIAGMLGLWWHHKHPGKSSKARPASVATAPPVVKPKLKPLVVAPQSPADFPRPVRDVFEAQVALVRRAISPGSLDSALGSQTRAAIAAFQRAQKLFESSALDTNTRPLLMLDAPLLTIFVVATNDLARLQPLGKTWLAKSGQTALDYETILELVAEKAHSYPILIQKLNPDVVWTNVVAGTVLKIPDANYPEPAEQAAFVVIHLSQKFLEAFGVATNLLFHCPCSIAAKVEKRPVGELHVIVVAPNPNYTVNPELFLESEELQAIGHKLILPPGPNNPVGVAWIGLDKPGYGMHGTPVPEQVGRTESHGCFRLANWDAEYLVKLVWVGMPVEVVP